MVCVFVWQGGGCESVWGGSLYIGGAGLGALVRRIRVGVFYVRQQYTS